MTPYILLDRCRKYQWDNGRLIGHVNRVDSESTSLAPIVGNPTVNNKLKQHSNSNLYQAIFWIRDKSLVI